MGEQAVVRARDELVREDLVAYRAPLTQVLSLPGRSRVERGGVMSLSEMFRSMTQASPATGRQP